METDAVVQVDNERWVEKKKKKPTIIITIVEESYTATLTPLPLVRAKIILHAAVRNNPSNDITSTRSINI